MKSQAEVLAEVLNREVIPREQARADAANATTEELALWLSDGSRYLSKEGVEECILEANRRIANVRK